MAEKNLTPPAAPVEAPRAATETTAAPVKTYYQVMHGAVGQWPQGTVISLQDDLVGIDVDRLLRLGAIAETAAPVAATPVVEGDTPPAE